MSDSEASTTSNRSNKTYQGISGIVGLVALIVGAMYLHSAEQDCPWSPKLPAYLVAYGTISVLSPVIWFSLTIFSAYLCSCCSEDQLARWSVFTGTFLSLVVSIGITIWGFTLLYSNKESVTYSEYGFNSTTPNANYCKQVIYLVPMVITWLSTVGFIIIGLVILCVCCVVCLKK